MNSFADSQSQFDQSLASIAAGEVALLIDDALTTPRGYLLFPAAQSTPERVCFLVNHARGLLFAAISEQRIRELGLPMMVGPSSSSSLDLTVSVEARFDISTGISASDRAKTLSTLATTTSARMDLVTPGHIFPWRAKTGGVLVRTTGAEAAVDLMELTQQSPVAALAECLTESGAARTLDELLELAKQFSLTVVRTSEIVRRRMSSESIVEPVAETTLPVAGVGVFRAITFRSNTDGAEHLALAVGEFDGADATQEPVLVRVQAEQGLPELLGLQHCRQSIFKALRRIHETGRGIFVFVRHPRKGLLESQIRQMNGPTERQHSAVAVLREFGVGAQILKTLGARRIILLGGTKHIAGIDAFQLEIVDQKPLS